MDERDFIDRARAEELDYVWDCNCESCVANRDGLYEPPATINTREIPITEILPETQTNITREPKVVPITLADMAQIMVDVLKSDVEAMGATIEVGYRDTRVNIHVPEVTLLYDSEQFTFEDFTCEIDVRYYRKDIDYEIHIRGDNLHPHMSDGGNFCMGDNYDTLYGYLRAGEFHSFLAHLTATLNTYSPGGAPYRGLGYTSNCDGCGESVEDDSTYYCETAYCDNHNLGSCCIYECHAYQYGYRGHGNFCKEHVEPCSDCNEYFCESHIYHCDRCGDAICTDHSYICTGCSGTFCESHISSCSNCYNRFCENCLDSGMCESCLEKSEETNEQEETEKMEDDTEKSTKYRSPQDFGYDQLSFGEELLSGEVRTGRSAGGVARASRTLPLRDKLGRFVSAVRTSTDIPF